VFWHAVYCYLALIRAILRMARDEWEWLDHIPKVKMYPEPKKRVRWITREESARLLTELPVHLADLVSKSELQNRSSHKRVFQQNGPIPDIHRLGKRRATPLRPHF